MNKIVGLSRTALFSSKQVLVRAPLYRAYAASDASKIKEHMEVLDKSGKHVGTVDKVQDGKIKLTKKDSSDKQHHYIDLEQVKTVNDKVHLSESNSSTSSGSSASGSKTNSGSTGHGSTPGATASLGSSGYGAATGSKVGMPGTGVTGTALNSTGMHGSQGGASQGLGAMGQSTAASTGASKGFGADATMAGIGSVMSSTGSGTGLSSGVGQTTGEATATPGETTDSRYSKPNLDNANTSGKKK